MAVARDFSIKRGQNVDIVFDCETAPVAQTACKMLEHDLKTVFDIQLIKKQKGERAQIRVSQNLAVPSQGFRLKVSSKGLLTVEASDSHGMAYGLLELSRLIGVSPWEWWADAVPQQKKQFKLKAGYHDEQVPSVEYRGIFINDEDWGLMPWSYQTNDPAEKGVIGPRTYARVCELLLRLRANYLWPAMHECSVPFFLTPGNREVAHQYGIFMGGSHCEPMACSTAVEWGKRGKGQYDYVNNAEAVRRFWTDRLQEVKDQDIVYTIGMRGVHDSGMLGVRTADEKLQWLQRVIDDQREMLRTIVNPDIKSIPQVFVPYKEVQEIYNMGLQVPEDVCLMWCDDNYGYIRHFPTDKERQRKGGNGVYYHASYWGAPQDHLWLGTFSPSLLFEQMEEAWERGIQRMWVLNVGDIKPIEYQMELFLDMAWNIDEVRQQFSDGNNHLHAFLAREFGSSKARQLASLMKRYYQLSYVRKPEFLGGTRVYESNRNEWYKIVDLPWTDRYVKNRIEECNLLEDSVEILFKTIPAHNRDTYFQLIKYPVQAMAEMNKKLLYAQLARHSSSSDGSTGLSSSLWALSDAAYDSIRALTELYNQGFDNKGKWNHMMDFQPRRLSVFDRVPHTPQLPDPSQRAAVTYIIPDEPLLVINGTDFKSTSVQPAYGLGLQGKAIKLPLGSSATITIQLSPKLQTLSKQNNAETQSPSSTSNPSYDFRVRVLPRFPIIENGTLRLRVTIDGKEFDCPFQTKYHEEQWKQGVLQNYAEYVISTKVSHPDQTVVTLVPLDDGIIFDQIVINR